MGGEAWLRLGRVGPRLTRPVRRHRPACPSSERLWTLGPSVLKSPRPITLRPAAPRAANHRLLSGPARAATDLQTAEAPKQQCSVAGQATLRLVDSDPSKGLGSS